MRSDGTIELTFRNTGDAAAVFHVRSNDGATGPWSYTVSAGEEVSDTFGGSGSTSYGLSVFAPNGFLRVFAGSLDAESANVTVKAIYDKEAEAVALVIQNNNSTTEKVTVADAYTGKTGGFPLFPA